MKLHLPSPPPPKKMLSFFRDSDLIEAAYSDTDSFDARQWQGRGALYSQQNGYGFQKR